MQYILSQEEMDANRQKLTDMGRLPSPKKLQEFCSYVADNLIGTDGWSKGRVWGCILTTAPRNYCDNCPSRDVCPNPNKSYSK